MYSLVILCFLWFYNTFFLLQNKVCNDTIHLVACWFGWSPLHKTIKNPNLKTERLNTFKTTWHIFIWQKWSKLVCGSKFSISSKVSIWTIHLVNLFKNTYSVSPLLSGDSTLNSIFTLFGTVFVGEAKLSWGVSPRRCCGWFISELVHTLVFPSFLILTCLSIGAMECTWRGF